MNRIITVVATGAILGASALTASAENFFKKVGRKVRESHDRHVEMMSDAHERHARILHDAARDRRCDPPRERHHHERIVIRPGECGYGEGHGEYETIEVEECVPGYFTTVYEMVKTPGRYECRQVEEVVPGYFKQVWVEPVYRFEKDCHGHQIKIQVSCGYFKKVWVPPTTCIKTVKVWVEGDCKRVARKVWVPEQIVKKCIRVWVTCR